MTEERVSRIRVALEDAFAPTRLVIEDQSHLHAGHAGAKDGRGHFQVEIVASAFAGKTQIQSHRLIYGVLDDMMKSDIHALSIQASAPAET